MKKLSDLPAILGVLIVIYCVVGWAMGGCSPAISFLGLTKIYVRSGLTLANSLMLMAILLKLTAKEK